MADTAPVLHAPAMKVGGRRLSVSTRHKASSQMDPSPPQNENKEETALIPDYPRPAPPTDNAPPQQNHQHNEEPPKKERNDKKVLELAARKAEMTRPTRDNLGGKDHGIGIRIRQPSGKALGD